MDSLNALSIRQVMFPDMDAEVIEAVLRANNGAVDATIVSSASEVFFEGLEMPSFPSPSLDANCSFRNA